MSSAEPVVEVLGQALNSLLETRERLLNLSGSDQAKAGQAKPATPPGIHGIALDVRLLARDITEAVMQLQGRLGASV